MAQELGNTRANVATSEVTNFLIIIILMKVRLRALQKNSGRNK